MSKIIMDTQYDYLNMQRAIRELCERFPFLNTEVIGKSVGGRDITAIKIGRSDECVLYAGAFHGSEHITTNILLRFTEEICSALQNDTSIGGLQMRRVMLGRGLIIVPRVNPDGAEISINGPYCSTYMSQLISRICLNDHKKWNANMRGVDINHNFSAGWKELHKAEQAAGIYGPAMTRYGGEKPESEPETCALVKLCRIYKIRHALAFHSQGEVIYWQYNNIEVPRAKKMAEIMSSVSGYELDNPTGLAVGGGFKDWFITEFCRPAFTVEVGQGVNPLPIGDAEKIYNDLEKMLVLCLAM